MKKVAILYIALGRYIVFWKEFYESSEEMLLSCEKHYFIWTDCPQEQLEYGNRSNVTVIPAIKRGWPHDSLLRFAMFLEKKEEILACDYAYFFNGNMKFYNPTDLSEIAPNEWNDGLIAGAHPSELADKKFGLEDYPFERNPQSTACVPHGNGRHYVCGAFNGGTSKAYIEMCTVLKANIQKDIDNGINACVDDESHLNAYLQNRNYLFACIAYGFPEKKLKKLGRPGHTCLIKIISRRKSNPKYGGLRYLRGQTDKKNPTNPTVHLILKSIFRIATWFTPSRKMRRKIRSYYE